LSTRRNEVTRATKVALGRGFARHSSAGTPVAHEPPSPQQLTGDKDFRKDKIMSTLRIPAAISASAVALLCASTSFAQETIPTTTTSTTTSPETVQQPAPSQQITVQQPAPAPAPVVVAPAPVATTQTTAAPYTAEGDRMTERTVERRPNRTLLSTGGGIFLLSYAGSVVAGAVSDRDADRKLFIPVVGPWLDLGDRNCNAANPCGGNEDVAKAMIITSGVVQGAGVLLALSSLVIPESTHIEERTTTARVVKPTVRVAPVSFNAGAGLGAIGRF
jgi:hypothetical protein